MLFRSRVAQMRMAAIRPASLDAPIGDEDSNNFAEVVQDENAETPYEQLEDKTVTKMLREMVTTLPARERENVAAAFREILLNAIEHGAGSDPDKKVTITYVRGERAVLYYVRDPGKGFSMEGLGHAAISNPVDSPVEHAGIREQLGLRPGGFGIMMTRQMVDELIYNEAGNEVLLIKYLH